MGWFEELFKSRVAQQPKQKFFEGSKEFKERVYVKGKENILEGTSGARPKQGFFEGGDSYRRRIAHESNQSVVEKSTGKAQKQGFLESDETFRSRMAHQANEEIVAGSSGDSPKQGIFENDESYRTRISQEAKERIVESATGSAPKQGFFESDDGYSQRVTREASKAKASDTSESGTSSSEGCFLTTACVHAKGLPDDCHELDTLRKFRDEFVFKIDQGEELIQEYYRVSPRLVSVIRDSEEEAEAMEWIYCRVSAALEAIRSGDEWRALRIYKGMVVVLEKKYLSAYHGPSSELAAALRTLESR